MSWHASSGMLERYGRGDLDGTQAMSMEAHLLECAQCRSDVVHVVDPEPLRERWTRIAEIVDAPHPGVVERLLVRARVSDHLARLLAATPSLTLSWLAAVAASLLFAVLAAHADERGLLLFLGLAPLLPLAGVAAAYGSSLDPTFEIALSAPMRSFRLLLIRTLAVVVTTVALAAAAAAALPDLDWRAAAWLLPALAVTSVGLALASYAPPAEAFGSVAFAWIALVALSAATSPDDLVAFGPAPQLAFLIVLIGAAFLVLGRRDAFDVERSL